MKYGDVVSLAETKSYLAGLPDLATCGDAKPAPAQARRDRGAREMRT